MRTELAKFNNMAVVVRNHYRRTALMALEYQRVLYAHYPGVAALANKAAGIAMPKKLRDPNSLDEQGKPTETVDLDDQQRYFDDIGQLLSSDPVFLEADAHLTQIRDFLPLVSRLDSASGTPFAIGADHRFDKENLIKAYEHYLDEDENEGLWAEIAKTITEIDAPTTPVHQQPPEALTAEQLADPLSVG